MESSKVEGNTSYHSKGSNDENYEMGSKEEFDSATSSSSNSTDNSKSDKNETINSNRNNSSTQDSDGNETDDNETQVHDAIFGEQHITFTCPLPSGPIFRFNRWEETSSDEEEVEEENTSPSGDDKENENVLDNLLSNKEWASALERLKTAEGQEEARTYDNLYPQHYPIHTACEKQNVPLNIIVALLDVFPDGATKFLKFNGQLPIHMVIENNASLDIMKALINAYPAGLHHVNGKGCLPIHVAAFTAKSVDVISLLIAHYPNGSRKRKHHGNLPLHDAARGSDSVVVVEKLLQEYPKGIKQKNKNGRLPLHEACKRNSKRKETKKILELLLDAYPESIVLTCPAEEFVVGDIITTYQSPLEIAVKSSDSAELISFLKNAEEMFYISLARRMIKLRDTAEPCAITSRKRQRTS